MNPPNATTIDTDSISAPTVAAVRRGDCTRLSAASAPSTGSACLRSGRSAFASHSVRAGASSSPAADHRGVAGVEEHLRAGELRAHRRHHDEAERQPELQPGFDGRGNLVFALLKRLHRVDAGGAARGKPRGEQAGEDADPDPGGDELRADAQLRHALGDATGQFHDPARVSHDERRARDPQQHAQHGTGCAGDDALQQEHPLNLKARRPQGAKNADLGPPLRDGDRERVVDDERADDQREQAGDRHPRGVTLQQCLEVLAAGRGRLDLEAGPECPLDRRLAILDGHTFPGAQIHAIETAVPAEHLLGRVDVHHHQVSAECLRQASGGHDAPHGERPISLDGAKRNRAADREAMARGEVGGDHQRIRLREKDERIVDGGRVRVLERVVAQAAVPGHVDAEKHQAALGRVRRVDDGLDDRHRDTDFGNRLDAFERRLLEAEFSGRDLQLGRAGNLVDRLIERVKNRPVRGVHGDEHGDAEHDARQRQRPTQHMPPEIRPAEKPEEPHAAYCALRSCSGAPGRRRS